ncbi:MAG: MBL fold metallo-hydrolase [Spirochaetota bacterium]
MNKSKRTFKLQDKINGVRGIWLAGLSFFKTYSYIVETLGGVLLIDTCGPGTGKIIKNALESMNLTPSDITGIALTHWHKDHTGSLAEIVSMAGTSSNPVKIFIHKEDAPFLLSQKKHWIKMNPEIILKVPHSPGKLPEKEKYQLIELDHLSGKNPLEKWGFESIHTPGHTPGHTSFLYKKNMSLFAGCGLSLFNKNTVGIVPIHDNRKKQIESAKKLAAMDFTYLYPAHLSLRKDEIKKNQRIPFKGKVSLTDRLTGTLPIFRYPSK